jgi:hypothetical protein
MDPRGHFDILLVATALHHNLTVLTYNIRHFNRIPAQALLNIPLRRGDANPPTLMQRVRNITEELGEHGALVKVL